jgi:hypothetical protein
MIRVERALGLFEKSSTCPSRSILHDVTPTPSPPEPDSRTLPVWATIVAVISSP